MANATFGPLSAELDRQLLNYFHKTTFINKLLTYPPGEGPFLVLSRPGAGKTALKKWLLSGQSTNTAISLDPDSGRVFVDDQQFTNEDYRALLRAELLTGVIGEIIERKPTLKQNRQDKTLREAYELAEDCLTNRFWKSATSFFKERFAGLQVLGCGFNLHQSDRRRYLDQVRRNDVANRALDALETLMRVENRTFYLVADNPEYVVGQGHDLTDRTNSSRIGALLNLLAEIHSVGLRVTTFTKFHIFKGVQEHYTDYSHFADGVAQLEWTTDDLLQFVKLRVEKRLDSQWKKVFSVSEREFVAEIFPRLVNGPRDLLFLLEKARSEAMGAKLSKDHLLKACYQLRDDKYQDMSRLFGGDYPGVDAFCKAAVSVVRGLEQPLTMSSVETALDASISDPSSSLHGIRGQYNWVINVQAGSPRAVNILGHLGAFVFVRDGNSHYPWEGHPLEALDASDSIELSPLFCA